MALHEVWSLSPPMALHEVWSLSPPMALHEVWSLSPPMWCMDLSNLFVILLSINSVFANQMFSGAVPIFATTIYQSILPYSTTRHTLLIPQPSKLTLMQLIQLLRTCLIVLTLQRNCSASPCSHSVTPSPLSPTHFPYAARPVMPSAEGSVVICSRALTSTP